MSFVQKKNLTVIFSLKWELLNKTLTGRLIQSLRGLPLCQCHDELSCLRPSGATQLYVAASDELQRSRLGMPMRRSFCPLQLSIEEESPVIF